MFAFCPVQVCGAGVSLSQCTVSGVFSALSLPYLFGFALTVNHTAATPSKLNTSKNSASIPFTDKFSHLSVDSLHLVPAQT